MKTYAPEVRMTHREAATERTNEYHDVEKRLQLYQVLPQVWRAKINGKFIVTSDGSTPLNVCTSDANSARREFAKIHLDNVDARKQLSNGWVF